MGAFLCPPGFEGPKGLRALGREASVVAEGTRLAGRALAERRLRSARPYANRRRPQAVQPVLLVPGFMAGDYTLAALARFLRSRGLRTYRSHIHVNVGCTQRAADRLERRIEQIAIRRDHKVSIVGHSLGGMLARGVAARRPDLVQNIVTMGSPVLAPAAVHQVLAWDADLLTRLSRAGFGGMMGEDCIAGTCARRSFDESQLPLAAETGFTAIYSKRDGIVDWRSCLDPAADAVEVRTSHCGMALDPAVFAHVSAALRGQAVSSASLHSARSA